METGSGFGGCWERRQSSSLYICSFAPFWLCAAGSSVSTAAARIRISAALELSPWAALWKNMALSYRKPTPCSGNEDPTHFPITCAVTVAGFSLPYGQSVKWMLLAACSHLHNKQTLNIFLPQATRVWVIRVNWLWLLVPPFAVPGSSSSLFTALLAVWDVSQQTVQDEAGVRKRNKETDSS